MSRCLISTEIKLSHHWCLSLKQVSIKQTKKTSTVVCFVVNTVVNSKAATGCVGVCESSELYVCVHVQLWVKLGIRAG